jgi:hypothetical protein
MCRGYSRGLGGFVPLSVPGSRTTLAGVGGGGGAAWLAAAGRRRSRHAAAKRLIWDRRSFSGSGTDLAVEAGCRVQAGSSARAVGFRINAYGHSHSTIGNS